MDLRDQLQRTLGNAYTLDRELGGGGMSRVFVATETALGRQIVVKVLPPDAAAAVSAERFKREIKLAAQLQHPHIVPVLTAGESDGLPFYTMPFVKGESLRTRLSRSGELSVNESVHILRDIASALAYAHGEGVVHRDIKPENVILSGGVAVVTDFGVAKAMDLAVTEGGGAKSGLTSLGVALGTPAYMAPEQATADPQVDHRADIYSFGCLAYELLAGSSPFAGRSPQQLLAAHVTDAPEPLLKRRPTVPPALAAMVMKCLEKRAGDRPQSAEELITALDAIATPSGGTTPTGARPVAARANRGLWVGLALVAIVAGAAALFLRSTPFRPLQAGAATPVAITPELEFEPAISPDGKLVAYGATTPAGTRIFVRQIDGGRANLLTGELDGDHRWPRWSPDGSRISFGAQGAIYIVPALGGSPKRTMEGGPTHAWSPDGKQLAYGDTNGIWIRPIDGGTPRHLVGGLVHSPSWSPSGRLLAYVEGDAPRMNNISTSAIWIVPVSGGQPTPLSDSTHTNVSPIWAADGRSVLFVSSALGPRDVYQQPVHHDGRPDGPPSRLTTALNAFAITLSADGSRLAYDVVRPLSNIWKVLIPPSGPARMSSAQQVTRENQHIEGLSLSHNGKWLAYDSDRGGNFDIYKLSLGGGDPVQLTTNPGNDFHPTWSPDDKEIAFHSQRGRARHIYVMSAEGNAERQVSTGPRQDRKPAWSPDGRQLMFMRTEGNYNDIVLVSRGADGNWSAPRELSPDRVQTGNAPAWSSDGRFIAHNGEGKVSLISSDGESRRTLADGDQLRGRVAFVTWGRDAGTVYAVAVQPDGGQAIWAVPVAGGSPHVVLADEPTRRFGRVEFTTDGRQLFFTLAAWESDVWVMELTPRK
ncbi:MAG TPA: protein kinase [Gemmatimonadaceae bacterium]|nr:protein kinase [Gemmatimonadaceae bacterium]